MFGRKKEKICNLDTDKALRELIQQQMDFAYAFLCVKVKNFMKIRIAELGIDPKLVNVALVTEIIYNEVVRWIIFNHITTEDKEYIKNKQDKMWLTYVSAISNAYLESSNSEEMKQITKTLDWYGDYWHNKMDDQVIELLTELERIKFMNHYN